MKQKKLIINPELNLHELFVFKCIWITGFLSAIALSGYIWPRLPNATDNFENLNHLIFVILKVPFAISAVTLSMLVIIGTMHRSAQTVRQIEISINQNNIANYYKNLDEFKMFIKSNDLLKDECEKKSIKLIHDKFWPNYLNSNYDMNIEMINQFEEKSKDIFNILIKESRTLEDYKKWVSDLNDIRESFDFKEVPAYDGIEGFYNDSHISQFFSSTNSLFKKAIEVCSFEIDVKSRKELKQAILVAECPGFDFPAVSNWLIKQSTSHNADYV